jgi:DNA-binding NtrC family response regulator
VLLLGETGTGKEVSPTPHHLSSRAQPPFIRVQKRAIPETLLEASVRHEKAPSRAPWNTKPDFERRMAYDLQD